MLKVSSNMSSTLVQYSNRGALKICMNNPASVVMHQAESRWLTRFLSTDQLA